MALPRPAAGARVGDIVSTQLVRFEAARQALAEARTVDEVKDVRDKAEALRLYMKQAGHGLEMQNDVAEIKLRAERRAGELLSESIEHGGKPKSHAVTLADLGMSKMQSSRWQAEASVPEADFERHIATVRTDGGELTSVGLLRLARATQQEKRREQHRRDNMRPFGGDPSPVSNGIVPLEAFWGTVKEELRERGYELLKWEPPEIVEVSVTARQEPLTPPGWGLRHPSPEILADPRTKAAVEHAAAALEGLRQAMQRAVQQVFEDNLDAITDASEALILAGDEASHNLVLHGAKTGPQREEMLAANERQKNARGYCAHLGCWQPVNGNSRCEAHPEGNLLPPAADTTPTNVFEPAAEGAGYGRPGWASWGLEA